MTKNWIMDRKQDYYYRLAKEEGYRSRAAFKLLQLAEKHAIIHPGDTVLDLGAAPGGWMQAARQLVKEKGFILGVDLKPIEDLPWSNTDFLVGDIRAFEKLKLSERLPQGKADIVLSDISPNISGAWEVDHARQIELAELSLKVALSILRPGGNFLVKVFQGDLLGDFVAEVKRYFLIVKIVKPRASRAESAEQYLVGMRKI
jgi:23S rRNA (uridine2552-2'-O)-methyltransferase